MKNRVKRCCAALLAIVMVFTCAACGNNHEDVEKNTETEKNTQSAQIQDFEGISLEDGKEGEIYTVTITSGEQYDATVFPEKHFLGATAAFSGMKIQEIVIQVKFYEDGTYTYVASDCSAVEMTHERWMHREYVWTGTYIKEGDSYAMSVPTTATLQFVGAKAYEAQAALIGALGSFTHESNPELLTMFEEATATVEGENITFALVNASTEEKDGPKEGQTKVACIGDSITYGHGVTNWETENYPAVLQNLLGEEYYVANFGCIGACVNDEGDKPYKEQSVYQQSIDYDADIIVFMLGSNDSKVENWNNADAFVEDYKALLDSYFADDRQPKVYIGLCAESFDIDNPEMEYGIQPKIVDEIVDALKDAYADAEMIDIHSLTTAHPEWFEKDGVHPNTDGAKAIAEAIAAALK